MIRALPFSVWMMVPLVRICRRSRCLSAGFSTNLMISVFSNSPVAGSKRLTHLARFNRVFVFPPFVRIFRLTSLSSVICVSVGNRPMWAASFVRCLCRFPPLFFRFSPLWYTDNAYTPFARKRRFFNRNSLERHLRHFFAEIGFIA